MRYLGRTDEIPWYNKLTNGTAVFYTKVQLMHLIDKTAVMSYK